MIKNIILYIILLLAVSGSLQAQYAGGDGRGDKLVSQYGTLLNETDAIYRGGAGRGDFKQFLTRSWNGSHDDDWNNPVNWTPNFVPSNSDDAIILSNINDPSILNNPAVNSELPAVCNNLTIESSSLLLIPQGTSLTVYGNLINKNSTSFGVSIKSDATGTGSLIIKGQATGTGLASVKRYMTAGAWHVVSSPLSGQSVDSFLFNGSNINVATNGTARGMMDYDPLNNKWNDFFTNAIGGTLETGKGFSMRLQGASASAVNFTGLFQAGPLSAATSGGYWNCIGNPYTSAIGITNSTSSDNFITLNASKFQTAYGAIYVWDNPDANNAQYGKYTIINNAYHPFTEVQQGQAFMVNLNPGVNSVDFTPGMQIHSTSLVLKSSKIDWPTIKLLVIGGEQGSSTILAFNTAMTKGLDPTYDAGLLKGGSDLVVYSRLVDDIGIPFAIQALPDNNFRNMKVAIGLDFKTGGEVTFSTELINLPPDCNAVLEDRETKTFTDLSVETYKAIIAPNSSITDRFYLYTFKPENVLVKKVATERLTAFANRNINISLTGDVGKKAVATLYDLHGRVVLVQKLNEGGVNIIPTPNIKDGIYLLSINENGKHTGLKILVRE